ncbi:translocator protein homolog [Abrus precatorius]|uniref:Translocator protein homolog n=1 Tax=Abrus precatorius TaxID=3816 RepID=A0A8B8LCS9_ABRPR|nr:translocator protein homolog [Abrus precatorius]
MASNDLKHRITPNPGPDTMNDKKKRRDKRMVMAKRGLRSLAIAVFLPLSLTVLSACIGSSMHSQSRAHDAVTWRKPFWFPPSWALHLTCPASSFLMGLSAWMVWADGGFHRNPMALLLYFTQLLFTVLWDPIVLGAGATRVGLMVCFGLFLSQVGCMRVFRPINPIAGDLIKPCLPWIAFLFIVNLKLLFV